MNEQKTWGMLILFSFWEGYVFRASIFLFRIEVAIKEGNSGDAAEEMVEEAKAMIRVSKHNHIVNFQGISLQGNKVYVLLEFCSFGSIDNFLQRNSIKFGAMLENQDFRQIVSWCKQVADGMEFLVAKGIIHVSAKGNKIQFIHYM